MAGKFQEGINLIDFSKKSQEFIENSNIIFINGEIDNDVYEDTVSRIIYYASLSRDPIYFIINSSGGSVYATYGIISVMESIDNDIVGVANGIVASASLILLANCDYRYALKGSNFMHHLPFTQADGTSLDMESLMKELSYVKDHEYFKKADELSPKDVDLTKNIDYTFTLDEAVKSGLIQKVVTKFDDIVPEHYVNIIKQSITKEIFEKIIAIYEEYEDPDLFKSAIEMVTSMVEEVNGNAD